MSEPLTTAGRLAGRYAFRSLFAGGAGIIFVLAIAVPLVALVGRSVGADEAPASGWWLSWRQWALLRETVGLAAGAVIVAFVLALPGAYVVGQFSRLSERPLLVAVMVAPLLLPPMVYAFGWQRLITLPGKVQCIWVWGAWSWPIPALILGSGWSRFGRCGYEAALLSTSAGSAFLRVVLPVLLRYVAVGGLVLFVLFLGEYTVPHACGLSVYATDLLGLAENQGARTIEVLWPSLPLVLMLGLSALVAWRLWRRSPVEEDGLHTASAAPALSRAFVAAVVAVVVVSVAVPLLKLAWHPSTPQWLVDSWRTYHGELLESLAVSVVAGVVAATMGMGMFVWPAGGAVAGVLALVFGILPGALVGAALVASYLNVPTVYDSWVVVVLAGVARFGWVGVLCGWLAMRSVRRDLVSQARVDGADEFVVDTRIRLWPNWPTVACGVCLVAAFSLADVTAISLVRVPTIGAISLTLIEKMHRFEEGMLVSLSLWLVASALPGAVLAAVALRRRG